MEQVGTRVLHKLCNITLHHVGASGFVARESVTFVNLTLTNQAFGMSTARLRCKFRLNSVGLVTNSNVTMDDNVSGILGLGFPRLSSISNTIANGA